MKKNGLKKIISSAIVSLAMLIGIAAAASVSAYAQERDYNGQHGRNDNHARWDRTQEGQYAYLLGYHEAYGEFRDVNGRRVSYKDMPGYREGTNGFLVWMGDRNTYRDSYRKGFKEGFEDAQRRRQRRYDRGDVERVLGASLKDVYNDDRYDRDENYSGGRHDRDSSDQHDRAGRADRNEINIIAEQNGYRDGLRQGEEGRNRRRANEYENIREYRDALSGYRNEYGDRNQYRQAYREGYRRGYTERNRR